MFSAGIPHKEELAALRARLEQERAARDSRRAQREPRCRMPLFFVFSF